MYQDFINENVAPFSATKIGVYNSNSEKIGKIELGNLNRITGQKLYSFGLLSDIHNRSNQDDENNEDIQRALTYFNQNEEIEFICCCGDIAFNATESEFQQFKNNIDNYSNNTPFYTCTGNHDCQSGLNETLWQTYTGNSRCFEITQGTDKFLFFGMNKASFGASGTPYLDSDIDWLENKLEQYRNQRVFIFTHLFFPNRAGDFRNLYTATLGGSQLTRIQALCDKYLNSVWFSGHSHWKWNLQKYQDNANIYKNNSGWCVHVPSCAYPRDTNTDLNGYTEMKLESEGAVVDVYSNFIVIRGRDFKNAKFLPIASYKLDTTLVDIPSSAVTCTNITLNTTSLAFNSSESQTLIATVTPSDTTESVSWSVEPTGVVNVVNGIVTPIANGNATITATCGSKSASCSVNVNISTTEVIPLTWKFGFKPNSSTGVEESASDSTMTVDYIPIDTSAFRYFVSISKDFQHTSFYCYGATKNYLGRVADLQHAYYMQGIQNDYELTDKILANTKFMLIKLASSYTVEDGNCVTLKKVSR